MRRSIGHCVAALLGAVLCASALPADAQSAVPQPGPEAEARLAELAERYADAKVDGSVASANDLADADASTPGTIEATPLGTPSEPSLGLGESSPGSGLGLSTLSALGIVITLILGGRWAYVRFGGRVVTRSSPAVEVLSRTSVAPKNQVLLLRVGQRVLVVGDSSSGLRTLANLDDPEEVASLLQTVTSEQQTSVSRSFGSLMSRFNTDYDEKRQTLDEGGDAGEYRLDAARESLSGLSARLRTLSEKGGAA